MALGDLSAQFDQLVRDMERASSDVKREVGALIPIAAESMATALVARYPTGPTGRLEDGVRIRTRIGQDPLLPIKQVVGPALAYIWQDGTRERYAYSRNNARRGRSPAHDPGMFQRIAVQTRANMLQQAQTILDRTREI
jgi:hypothetical protein